MQSDLLPAPELQMGDSRLTLMEAIVGRRLVQARYNNALVRLAPHQLFDRSGDLFLSALNLSKAWRSAEEQRLGQFKLAGLRDVELLTDTFEPLPTYNGTTGRPSDVVVLSI